MELKEVFEPVLNFIKHLQNKEKEPTSKQAAKDRLKLVLMQDRASVSPDFFEMMKKEIIDVIKKYIEIDEESLEVQLTRGIEAGLEGPALYANIPIKNVKPIAPQRDDATKEKEEQQENKALTEEQAEQVAENILNQIADATVEKSDDVEIGLEKINTSNEEKVEDVNIEIEKKDVRTEEIEPKREKISTKKTKSKSTGMKKETAKKSTTTKTTGGAKTKK